jgi:hypothetical protein
MNVLLTASGSEIGAIFRRFDATRRERRGMASDLLLTIYAKRRITLRHDPNGTAVSEFEEKYRRWLRGTPAGRDGNLRRRSGTLLATGAHAFGIAA